MRPSTAGSSNVSDGSTPPTREHSPPRRQIDLSLLPYPSRRTKWVLLISLLRWILTKGVGAAVIHTTRSKHSSRSVILLALPCKPHPCLPIRHRLTHAPSQMNHERISPYIYPSPHTDTLPALPHDNYPSRYDHPTHNGTSHHSRQPMPNVYRSYNEPTSHWHAPTPSLESSYVRSSSQPAHLHVDEGRFYVVSSHFGEDPVEP